MALKNIQQTWGKHQLPEGELCYWKIGPLRLYARFVNQELWIAHEQIGSLEGDGLEEGVDSLDWSRWALKNYSGECSLSPVFPDRPIVVKPEAPFHVDVGASAQLYFRVPVWIRIKAPHSEARFLCEVPTMPLSKTWFGEFFEGEYCYWVSSSARRVALVETSKPHLAVCPVKVTNKSGEDFLVERICHRVGALSIYEKERQLWSSGANIDFHGGGEISQIKTIAGAPKEASGAALISSARNPTKTTFRARTFRALQNLSEFGAKFVEDII